MFILYDGSYIKKEKEGNLTEASAIIKKFTVVKKNT